MVHITLYFEGFIIAFAHKWIKLVVLQVDLNPLENSTFPHLNNICDEVLLRFNIDIVLSVLYSYSISS
mgnify:CR=1 FL=1